MPTRKERLLLSAEIIFIVNGLAFYIVALPGIKLNSFAFHLETILLLVLAVKIVLDKQEMRYASSGTVVLYLLLLLTQMVFLAWLLYDTYLFYQRHPNGSFWERRDALAYLWTLFGFVLNVVLLIACKRKTKEYLAEWKE